MTYDVFLLKNDNELQLVKSGLKKGRMLKHFCAQLRRAINRGDTSGKIVVKDADGNPQPRRVWSNLAKDNVRPKRSTERNVY